MNTNTSNADAELFKPRDIVALLWQHYEFGADKGMNDAEAIEAIEQLLQAAKTQSLSELLEHKLTVGGIETTEGMNVFDESFDAIPVSVIQSLLDEQLGASQ